MGIRRDQIGVEHTEYSHTWSEVFDIIVDLKVGKLFRKKISDSDRRKIEVDMDKYGMEIFNDKDRLKKHREELEVRRLGKLKGSQTE